MAGPRRFDTAKAKRVLHAEGISAALYTAWTGGQTISQFPVQNPTWTMQSWTDLIRQNKDRILQCSPGI